MNGAVHIDGREGEGGGQILRSALALSVALRRPVVVEHARARRKRPGILRQHLAAVRAAAAVSGGGLEGDAIGSHRVALEPGAIRPGEHRFAVGSAGSALLVLQTVLPPLLLADEPSEVVVEGGTHNPLAPPFDAVALSLAPLVERAGARLAVELERPGFFPAGGGRVRARIEPAREPRPLELLERGAAGRHDCEVLTAHLPAHVADREWEAVRRKLAWTRDRFSHRDVSRDSAGPGNALSLRLRFEHVTEVATGFGEKGVPSARVAGHAVKAARRFFAADAPVGVHLADQLMVPLALLGGGRYRTLAPSLHARTNALVVDRFLPGAVRLEERGEDDWLVEVAAR